MDGKITKNAKIKLYVMVKIPLKGFEMKEVAKGYDCGIQIKGFNDIEEKRYY